MASSDQPRPTLRTLAATSQRSADRLRVSGKAVKRSGRPAPQDLEDISATVPYTNS